MKEFNLIDKILLISNEKEIRGYKNTVIFTLTGFIPSEKCHVIEAKFLLNRHDKILKVLETGVDELYRKKGIASFVYDEAEKMTGCELTPGDDQTEGAKALWSKRKDRGS